MGYGLRVDVAEDLRRRWHIDGQTGKLALEQAPMPAESPQQTHRGELRERGERGELEARGQLAAVVPHHQLLEAGLLELAEALRKVRLMVRFRAWSIEAPLVNGKG